RDLKNGTTLSQHRRVLRGSAALGAIVVALSFAGEANAQTAWNGGSDGKWTDTTWSNGVPAAATTTDIANGKTVTIETSDAAAVNVEVGNDSKLVIVTGGVLTTTPDPANAINKIGYLSLGAGAGAVLIDGGTWNAGSSGIDVGDGVTGTLTVQDGGQLKTD